MVWRALDLGCDVREATTLCRSGHHWVYIPSPPGGEAHEALIHDLPQAIIFWGVALVVCFDEGKTTGTSLVK